MMALIADHLWQSTLFAAVAVVAGVSTASAIAAQAPSASRALPSFAVASIKPNPSGGGDILMQVLPGGRANIANATLRILIRQAYRLQDFQIVGGPGWINSDRFNITARAEGNPSGSQMQDMLRALLIDRFKLVAHEERRELPIYALVMARSDRKPGVQLHQAKPCFRSPVNLPPQNLPLGETPCGFRLRPGMIAARGVSMAALSYQLASQVSRVVVDRTGLAGDFDFEMEFTPFQRPATLDAAASSDRPVDAGPSIFTALQEQLGLKLDADRGAVDVLVIDRAEPPTPD